MTERIGTHSRSTVDARFVEARQKFKEERSHHVLNIDTLEKLYSAVGVFFFFLNWVD